MSMTKLWYNHQVPIKDPEKRKLYKKEWRLKNIERIKENSYLYRLQNKDKIFIQNKKYREKNKETIRNKKKLYRELNCHTIKHHKREYYSNNKEKILFKQRLRCKTDEYKQKRNKKFKIRYKNDVTLKIQNRLRCRLWECLKVKGLKKTYKASELLGCSVPNFIKYIELLFRVGMTWNNYGDWHIDHIRPCASFDLSDLDQQKQ
jgi:hypothetical protein